MRSISDENSLPSLEVGGEGYLKLFKLKAITAFFIARRAQPQDPVNFLAITERGSEQFVMKEKIMNGSPLSVVEINPVINIHGKKIQFESGLIVAHGIRATNQSVFLFIHPETVRAIKGLAPIRK